MNGPHANFSPAKSCAQWQAGIIDDPPPGAAIRGVSANGLTQPSLPCGPWPELRPAWLAQAQPSWAGCAAYPCPSLVVAGDGLPLSNIGKLLVSNSPTVGLDNRNSRLIACNSWRSSSVKMNTSRTNHLGLHGLTIRRHPVRVTVVATELPILLTANRSFCATPRCAGTGLPLLIAASGRLCALHKL
jgi:hypothetical protein